MVLGESLEASISLSTKPVALMPLAFSVLNHPLSSTSCIYETQVFIKSAYLQPGTFSHVFFLTLKEK